VKGKKMPEIPENGHDVVVKKVSVVDGARIYEVQRQIVSSLRDSIDRQRELIQAIVEANAHQDYVSDKVEGLVKDMAEMKTAFIDAKLTMSKYAKGQERIAVKKVEAKIDIAKTRAKTDAEIAKEKAKTDAVLKKARWDLFKQIIEWVVKGTLVVLLGVDVSNRLGLF
jgi:hypothetical protein